MTVLLPFFYIALTLLFAASVMGGIAFRSYYDRAPGLAALLYPFSILFASGGCEGLRVLSGLIGNESVFLSDLASAMRLLNGLGWFLLCHEHLRIHGLLGKLRRLNAPVIGLTAIVFFAYIAAAFLDRREPVLAVGLTIMSLTGLYAAMTGILVLRKQIRLWPSALAGLRMGVFALIVYPSSLISERLSFTYPFLDPDRTAFEQLYPFYMTVFVSLSLPALFSRSNGLLREPGDSRVTGSLTDREREIVLLLRDGQSLKEIADALSLSVSTIKSHSNSAYRKLGVSGRKELSLISLDSSRPNSNFTQ